MGGGAYGSMTLLQDTSLIFLLFSTKTRQKAAGPPSTQSPGKQTSPSLLLSLSPFPVCVLFKQQRVSFQTLASVLAFAQLPPAPGFAPRQDLILLYRLIHTGKKSPIPLSVTTLHLSCPVRAPYQAGPACGTDPWGGVVILQLLVPAPRGRRAAQRGKMNV